MSDTWKLVPVEPTEQMIEAGRHVKRMRLLDSVKALREGRDPDELMGKTAGAEYRAMLEAAPAPPVPQTVQEITRLIQPYVAACLKFNYTPMELIEEAEADVNAAFKPIEAAITALVEKNHELQFSLDGVNAMRGAMSDQDRTDMLVGRAINRAARDLPDMCEIEICVEAGAGWVVLCKPNYDRETIDGDEPFYSQIDSAVDKAIADHGIEPEQGESHG